MILFSDAQTTSTDAKEQQHYSEFPFGWQNSQRSYEGNSFWLLESWIFFFPSWAMFHNVNHKSRTFHFNSVSADQGQTLTTEDEAPPDSSIHLVLHCTVTREQDARYQNSSTWGKVKTLLWSTNLKTLSVFKILHNWSRLHLILYGSFKIVANKWILRPVYINCMFGILVENSYFSWNV